MCLDCLIRALTVLYVPCPYRGVEAADDALARRRVRWLEPASSFRAWDLGFGGWGLGSGVWVFGFGARGLGLGVWGLGSGVCDQGVGAGSLGFRFSGSFFFISEVGLKPEDAPALGVV